MDLNSGSVHKLAKELRQYPAILTSRLAYNPYYFIAPREGKMTQIARCDWLNERAWCSGLPAVSRKKNSHERHLKADLRGTTLTHSTSLRQAHDMTWDQLHAYAIFFYKIKYAHVCTGIYGAKKF